MCHNTALHMKTHFQNGEVYMENLEEVIVAHPAKILELIQSAERKYFGLSYFDSIFINKTIRIARNRTESPLCFIHVTC